jgi:sterol desaturase/sphingolipid hydroxylase (fatty acid hydroxylase superfamily)
VDIIDAIATGNGFPYIVGAYVLILLVERAGFALLAPGKWHEKDARTGVLNSSLNAVFDALIGAAAFVALYLAVYQFRLIETPWTWLGWVAAFLLHDLLYYVDHRVAHRTGFFWAMHSVHHSSRELNSIVASRGIFLDKSGLSAPLFFLMPLLGVPLGMFLVVRFVTNLWGIFNHTRLVKRMGVLDRIMATPSNHRVHHGTEDQYRDRNYGQVWLIWDRLFGTYAREEAEPVFGLTKPFDSYSLWQIQTMGFRDLFARMATAPRWRDRLAYLWRPPEWRHEEAEAALDMGRATT